MQARRFQLDRDDNLHVNGLFCRPYMLDTGLPTDVAKLLVIKRLDMRSIKARNSMLFEKAVKERRWTDAVEIAREVHAVMLAQRTALRNQRTKRA